MNSIVGSLEVTSSAAQYKAAYFTAADVAWDSVSVRLLRCFFRRSFASFSWAKRHYIIFVSCKCFQLTNPLTDTRSLDLVNDAKLEPNLVTLYNQDPNRVSEQHHPRKLFFHSLKGISTSFRNVCTQFIQTPIATTICD